MSDSEGKGKIIGADQFKRRAEMVTLEKIAEIRENLRRALEKFDAAAAPVQNEISGPDGTVGFGKFIQRTVDAVNEKVERDPQKFTAEVERVKNLPLSPDSVIRRLESEIILAVDQRYQAAWEAFHAGHLNLSDELRIEGEKILLDSNLKIWPGFGVLKQKLEEAKNQS